jgi:molecular chaperone DnaK
MELAKIRLSDDPYAAVREEYLTATGHLDTELARTDYETLIEPLLEKTLDCLQRSLSDARVTAAQVDKIMLVGGATRTPFVHALLSSRLGQEPRHEINPDLIVAMGAAIQGAALAGQPAPAILIDITAHTYSIAAVMDGLGGGFMPMRGCAPIIRRGTPLPVRKSEVFTTLNDGQDSIEVIVYQGEELLPDRNLELGKFMIEGLAAVSAGNEVVVEFQIDLNGLLKVTATEKRTGLAKSAVIDTAGHHRLNLDAARTNLAALFDEADAAHMHLDDDAEDDEDDRGCIVLDEVDEDTPAEATAGKPAAPAGLLAAAKSLRRRAEALLERGVAETDAQDIRARLSALSAAIQKSDWPALTPQTDQLSDVLFYLED